MKKRIVSLLMALVMVLSLVPATVWAAEDHDGQVQVIVENTTYAKSSGAAWDGTLVDKWVDLVPGSTMMDCIVSALGSYSQTGADSGYITEINGLTAGDGGAASGWMGTLNDWFTDVGFADIKAGDKLFAGDVIRVMYTVNGYGADIGGDWNTMSDTSLSALSFSQGTLSPDFEAGKTAYTLTLPEGVSGVQMQATATNKCNQVYLTADGTDYRRVETVPVHNGTVLTIRCGDAAEATDWSAAIVPTTYTVTVSQEGEAPQGDLDVTFKGLHSAQLASLKLYDFADGVKGEQDLLAGVTPEADGYKLMMNTKLPAGDYLVEGYNAEGQCNGSLVLTVKANQDNVFTLNRAYEIYATNDSYSWVEGTDYSIDVTVTAADGTDLQAKTGVSTTYGNTRTSCLFLEGGSLSITLTPLGEKAETYLPITTSMNNKATVDCGAKSFGLSIPKALDLTVTAPAGSTLRMGTFGNYYSYTFLEPLSQETKGDTMVARFRVPETNLKHFLRVQNPEGVTYWTFGKFTGGQEITVTRDDLHMDDASFNSSTVYHFEKNVYDLGNIYLNINRQGYKNLEVGQSCELDVMRNWQAIESFMNSQIALPDAHYQVLGLDGSASDVVTITPDADNSCFATMTANRAGTAIVLVTYDAMVYPQGMGGDQYTAIWPEFTGVFVVSVGADGSSIVTNTLMDRPTIKISNEEQKYLDAEHDILYYVGEQGASYSFTPEEGCTVTVARSTVTDKMTFNGFTSDGVSVDENGQVTVTGLTSGRHILRIEKDGLAAYQVVTAWGTSYDVIDAEGNILPKDEELTPGQTVTVQFHGMVSPKEKLAGVYNFNFSMMYLDADGAKYQTNPGSMWGAYDFSGNAQRQVLSVTVPETTQGYSYDLNGVIRVGGFAGVPTHRGISYTTGMDRQFGTTPSAVLGRLPELSLKLTGWYVKDVEQKIAAIGEVTLDSEEAIQAARTAYDALRQERKEQVSNYDVLVAAEARLAQLQDEAVANVEALIAAIGQPVTPASRAAVEAARAAYDALAQKLQARVGNYDVLLAAEARLAELNAENIYKTTGDYIAAKGTPVTGSIGGDWAVLGLARSGRDIPGADDYYASVEEYVRKAMDENGRLNRSRSTENSRLILALTAMGKDVTHVAGRNLLDGLDSMSFITKQSVNGPVWALLALDSHDYPVSGDVTREKLVRAILDTQREDGSWPVIASSQVPDVDMTAMAIQALAPYYENAQVKAAVDAALTFLAGVQNADGTFSEIPGTAASAESTAQVIVALTALGLDPTEHMVRDASVLDALCGFYVTGGGFRHLTDDADVDGMATEQGYYALAAYYRLTAGKTSLYDMSDVAITVTPDQPDQPVTPDQPAKPDVPRTGDESPVLVWMGMAALAGAAVLLMQNKKKRA